MPFRLQVDTSEVDRMTGSFPQYLNAEMTRLRGAASVIAKEALMDSFMEAATGQEGFYPQYIEHVLTVLSMTPIRIGISPSGFILEFTWNLLGNREELQRGFHQGAKLRSGGHHPVGVPWMGSENNLKNPQYTRYKAWLAIATGEPWETQKTNKKGVTKSYTWPGEDVNLDEALEETINARVSIWGNRAPEWHLLDEGTTWYPPVTPTAFTEDSYLEVAKRLTPLFHDAVNYAQYRAAEVATYGKARKTEGQSLHDFQVEISYLRNRNRGQFAPGYIG
jgi:hypothetical protein